MSDEPADTVALADTVSGLMYAIAGWMLIGLGGLGLVSVVGTAIGDPTNSDFIALPLVLLFSLLLITFGVFVNPRFRRRLNRRQPITRFGRVQSVDRRVLHATEGRSERCVECGTQMAEGLVRRYREAFVVAGVPVYTLSEGKNYYCPDCVTTESIDSTPQSDTIVERDGERLAAEESETERT